MDETKQALQFLSAFQRMAWDPQILKQETDALDRQFKSLVHEAANAEENTRTEISKHHSVPSSVTFVAFRPKDNPGIHAAENVANKRLKVCVPRPDELLQGWQGRMRAINCLPDDVKIDQLIGEMARQQNASISAETDFAHCAGIILGMSRESLLQNHTLTPFFNALEGLKPNKPGSKSLRHRQAFERKAPFRLGGKLLRYCLQCAEEDITSLGYSYWRRSHQLPGAIWCSKHGSQLVSTSQHDAFKQCPHQISDSFIDERVYALTQVQAEILKRYSKIACEILSQAPVIDSLAASEVLGRQAKAGNFRISRPGKRTTISNHLIRLLPIWWLTETSPRVHWIPDKYISTIDGVCIPGVTRYTTATLSLLAALFYSDTNEAIAEILKPRDCSQGRPRGFDFWASKNVLDEYIAQGGVVSRVAEQLSLPHSTVGVGLLNQGLPGLGKATSTIMAARTFLDGQSLTEACAVNGASIEELETLLRSGCSRLKTALNAIPSQYPQPTPSNEKKLRATG